MSEKQLKILGTVIHRPTTVTEAAHGAQKLAELFVEVENPNDKPLHVWASILAYDYDASTHVLSLYLTEHTPDLPPGIEMISNHPRTPVLVVINAKSLAKIKLPLPAINRRRVPGEGLGMAFVEEPIEQIERIDLHVQYADEPLPHLPKENPIEHRERLRAHGQVVRANITPTKQEEK